MLESWMTLTQVRLQLKFCSISIYATLKNMFFNQTKL